MANMGLYNDNDGTNREPQLVADGRGYAGGRLQVPVPQELLDEIGHVTLDCVLFMGEVLSTQARLDATTVMAASGAITACASLWKAVAEHGEPQAVVTLDDAATREFVNEWGARVNADGLPVQPTGGD